MAAKRKSFVLQAGFQNGLTASARIYLEEEITGEELGAKLCEMVDEARSPMQAVKDVNLFGFVVHVPDLIYVGVDE